MTRYLFFIVFFVLLFAGKINAQKQGQVLIDSLLQALSTAREDTGKVNILNGLSFYYSAVNPAEGIKYGQLSVNLAKELNWKQGEAWAYNSLGNNNFHKSDYPSALDYFYKSLKIHEELDNKKGIATLTGNIGNIYQREGNDSNALQYYFKALKAYGALNDRGQLGRVQGNIGLAYMNIGDYAKALEYDLNSLKIAKEGGSKYNIAHIYGNIGSAYLLQNNFPEALKNQFAALEIAEETGDKNLAATSLGNIGECYFGISKDTTGTIKQDSLTPIGKTANRVNAIKYLTRAISLCKETGFLGPLQEFLHFLSDAQLMSGDYKEALESYKQYTTLKDSIFNKETKIKVTNLETERELQVKDKQIIIDKLAVAKKRNERGFFIAGMAGLLVVIVIVFRNYKTQKSNNNLLQIEKQKVERRTEQLNVTNNELSATLENLRETQQQLIVIEKQKENEMIRNRISQDIHDDISGELTRISWLSETAKLKAGKVNATDIAALLEKINNSSRTTIGKLGEIIWAVNPDNDNVETLTAYMRNYIAKFLTDTSFSNTIDFPERVPALHINPELKRNLFLVMKEALNNAVKYSHARHITISLRVMVNNYTLTIADDGMGIDEKVVHGGGNGLKNMRSRMASVKGACTIESAPGAGTKIIFEGMFY